MLLLCNNSSQTKLIYFRYTCENCQILNRNEEYTCCSEFPEAPVCITQHPGFQAVCLNRWVIQTAWYQYKQQYHQPYDGPQHKLSRHIAYRQLVRWCWGVLGKEIRVSLPSCAVCCIRAHFPPPGLEDDFQFEGFHFPNSRVNLGKNYAPFVLRLNVFNLSLFWVKINNINHSDIYNHLKSLLLLSNKLSIFLD